LKTQKEVNSSFDMNAKNSVDRKLFPIVYKKLESSNF